MKTILKIGIAVIVLGMGTAVVESQVHASNFTIDIQISDTFTIDEEIRFSYSIQSDEYAEISYVAGIDCPSYPLPPLELQSGTVSPGLPMAGSFTLGTVSSQDSPQNCEARVTMLEPLEMEETAEFSIDVVEFPIVILQTCKDSECAFPSKTFYEGEPVHFDFTSDDERVSVGVLLTTPAGRETTLSLPEMYVPEEVGTYTVVSNDESYKLSQSPYQFAVVGGDTEEELRESLEIMDDMEDTSPVSGESMMASIQEKIEANANILAAVFLTAGVLVGTTALIIKRNEESSK